MFRRLELEIYSSTDYCMPLKLYIVKLSIEQLLETRLTDPNLICIKPGLFHYVVYTSTAAIRVYPGLGFLNVEILYDQRVQFLYNHSYIATSQRSYVYDVELSGAPCKKQQQKQACTTVVAGREHERV